MTPEEPAERGWAERDAGSLRARIRPASRAVRHVAGAIRAVWVSRGATAWRDGIRVCYGFQRLPGHAETVTGGLVKLVPLSRSYPNSPSRYNILYLVSSRLTDGVVALARRARRNGARIVVNQNGVAYKAWHGEGWERTNAPMAALLALADHVFYQSEFCRAGADRFLGVTPASAEILYNPVDLAEFAPGGDRPSRPLTLLLAGSQDSFYRVSAAIRTLAHLTPAWPDARLIVTGRLGWAIDRQRAADEAATLARELGVGSRVTFAGPYTQREAPAIYRSADILLHTKYNDPCPTVVLEAMAAGLPVVYSRSGGVPELVGPEAGLGVETPLDWEQDLPPDPELLARAVIDVWGRSRQSNAPGAAARRRAVEMFGQGPWIERHTAVFSRLVADAAGHAS